MFHVQKYFNTRSKQNRNRYWIR